MQNKKTSRDSLCSVALSSMTSALKAQNILFAHSINANITKIPASVSKIGCAYGISFSCEYSSRVRELLRNSDISEEIIKFIGSR